jgi:ribonuclease E
VAAAGEAEPEAGAEEAHIEGVPEHAEAGLDDNRNRRRGRRGGRRRRPEDGSISPYAAPGADQPELPPVYTGPTPANPFGGHTFDIFDVMEQAEERAPVEAVAAVEPAPKLEVVDETPLVIVTEPEPELEPAQAEASDVEPEAARVEASGAEPELELAPLPEPVREPEPVLEPEPELLVAANDAAEPAVKPIIIGGEQDAAVEKKRGWWRR